MRPIVLAALIALVPIVAAAPATASDDVPVCVTLPGPDPHQGGGDVCVATVSTPDVPPICWYDPHPPHQVCLT